MELSPRDLDELADAIALLDSVEHGLKEALRKTARIRKHIALYALEASTHPDMFGVLSIASKDVSILATTISAGLDQAAATFREVSSRNGGAE